MKTRKIGDTNKNFIGLINGHFAVIDLPGKQFAKCIMKNIEILRQELKDLEEAGKPSDEFLILAQQVNELSTDKSEDSVEQIKQLEYDNKELVETRKKQVADMEEKLSEQVVIELYIVTDDILPETISAKQMAELKNIIV